MLTQITRARRTAVGLALATLTAAATLPAPTAANPGYQKITDRSDFVAVVQGRELTMPGIRVTVGTDGSITGRAYGRDVSGAWRWEDGYFCRDLAWGSRDLGANCQMVSRNGATVRFTSDRGSGRYADLNLR